MGYAYLIYLLELFFCESKNPTRRGKAPPLSPASWRFRFLSCCYGYLTHAFSIFVLCVACFLFLFGAVSTSACEPSLWREARVVQSVYDNPSIILI